jgi:hypothetical protein
MRIWCIADRIRQYPKGWKSFHCKIEYTPSLKYRPHWQCIFLRLVVKFIGDFLFRMGIVCNVLSCLDSVTHHFSLACLEWRIF